MHATCQRSSGLPARGWLQKRGGLMNAGNRSLRTSRGRTRNRLGVDVPRIRHGLYRCPEYNIWRQMKNRCANERAVNYAWYGGRGIRVCERWRASFVAFVTDMGRRPTPKHTIDRYPKSDGDYEPLNCRWATRKEQMRNRAVCRWFDFNGHRMRTWELAKLAGLTRKSMLRRLNSGWSVERAVNTPLRCHR